MKTNHKPVRWAILGCGGYVAPRHMKAIKATGGELVAAMDPNDSVGILDSYSRTCKFFTSFEKFYIHIDQLRQQGNPIDWLAVCTPNWLHAAHMRFGLKNGMNVLCEKPLCVAPENLDGIEELEQETGKRVATVLQLRHDPELIKLKNQAKLDRSLWAGDIHDVKLTYVTGRGPWFSYAWKMDPGKSGGIAANIGVHFLDVLMWIFGPVSKVSIFEREPRRLVGFLELERAAVSFLLSTKFEDLPSGVAANKVAYRSMNISGNEVEFSNSFTDLHTLVYQDALAGCAPGIAEARPGVALAWELMHKEIER